MIANSEVNMKKNIIIMLLLVSFLVPTNRIFGCVRTDIGSCNENFIVQLGTPLKYDTDSVYVMLRQNSGSEVFCIEKGVSGPAYGNKGTGKNYCSEDETTMSSSMKAAIGYALTQYAGGAEYYYGIQEVIHKLLAVKNGSQSINSDLVFGAYNFNNIYNTAESIYNAYGNESLSFNTSSLNFHLEGNNYISNTIYLTITNMDSNNINSFVLKANGEIIPNSNEYIYWDTSNNSIYVELPNSLSIFENSETEKIDIKLIISGYREYKMAIPKSCGILQDIVERNPISKTITKDATASGSIIPNYCIANIDVNDRKSRIELYKTMLSKGKDWRNILNFDEKDKAKACGPAQCNVIKSSGCMVASYNKNSNFSENNFSCFTNTIEVDNKIGYCNTQFELGPLFENNISNIKSGQLYFNIPDGKIIRGSLSQTCYFVDDILSESITNGHISDYIKDTKLTHDEEIINLNIDEDSEVKLQRDNNKYSSALDFNYKIPGVWIKNLTGERIEEADCQNCKFLGYGILSKFNFKNRTDYNFYTKFKIDNEINEEYNDGVCSYNSEQEIIKSSDDNPSKYKFQLVYRSVNPDKPFLSKLTNGTRDPRYNWSNNSLDINSDNVYNMDDYNIIVGKLDSGEELSIKYDINGDKIINDDDLDILEQVALGKITYSQYIFKNTYDKYGYKREENVYGKPKYEINLTSKDIQNIRNYNSDKSYDDYDLECSEDTGICLSRFLSTLNKLIINDDHLAKKYKDLN